MSVGARRRPRRSLTQRRARLALVIATAIVAAVALIRTLGGGAGVPAPPRASAARGAPAGDPFGYVASRRTDFVARATAGNAHPLFAKSPGGALATAARVAAFRGPIDRATAGTGLDPNLLEALVFVESAGFPDAIAGSDPAGAAGLTQIVASTGQALLGMHIDLARSRKLSTEIAAVSAGRRRGDLPALLAQRRAADARFDPLTALAATVRYLTDAEGQFGRQDLAFESYHMGIGNLHEVLGAYDGGRAVPYVQLYFDSAPDHHPAAYRLLSGFGDDSWLYYWRLLGAEQIMRLYRSDRAALRRLSTLQAADGAGATVLHPPDAAATRDYADPSALATAYQHRAVVPLPTNAAFLHLAYDPAMGADASRVGAPRTLYRGLTPTALALLIELAARVRALSGTSAPLEVATTVADRRYLAARGIADRLAQTGDTFAIDRRYATTAQAEAFQAMLDRLQSLNLIAWQRTATTIEITVASDASRWAS
ncbi:MAG: transglycosylase SLT domain-containing protein [Solirubrobacterales bacterium]|nr:transglycosylase SLT domain-containing protein [Solirubrobacterales bacterium]